MVQKIEIIEKEIGNTLEIYEEIPVVQMPKVLAADFKKIVDHQKSQQDTELAGAPYTRYLDVDWDSEMKKSFFANFFGVFTRKWKILIGFPISQEITGKENIKHTVYHNKKFVKTLHKGPYKKVGATYKAMYAYMNENKLIPENESFEFYLNDPDKVKKEELETEVLIPIKN